MSREPKTPADIARNAWVSDCAAALVATGLQLTTARMTARMFVNRFGTAEGRAALAALIERLPVRMSAESGCPSDAPTATSDR